MTYSQVVTYSLAYQPGEVDLCSSCVGEHDQGEVLAERIGVLGAVSVGEHAGLCAGCDIEAEAAADD